MVVQYCSILTRLRKVAVDRIAYMTVEHGAQISMILNVTFRKRTTMTMTTQTKKTEVMERRRCLLEVSGFDSK